ncbi:putative transmembrane efflux protein [Streptomyces ambofaciens ATCC 23877]|uniref:Putative transmembrane efflux protein n=1 Tax=Streptomyces ambofaciens (strain ATCC 23877 / 3486 / DSM 40053 / JCM 4204 / NBRC 12836 / NRRL B-2516) TaxID=278992 RepID=A0A0K2B0V0_STRA7|nr:MFS transporter [Streptomyces ambofaciens]AKZ59000.1 putative transmembrane efflux protein [Streptomyces ambofaciens ATCC 23877]
MTTMIESPARTQVGAPSRWRALVVLCAGALMTILDGNIVTVAMPAIQADLGFSGPGLAWVVNAYLIPFGGLLLLAGRLGDLVGRKRMFTTGLALFTVASVLCGVATGQGLLIAARALQGLGGAMTMAVVLGMVVGLFPEPRERARAIAVFSAVGAAGGALGTFLGGALTEALNWHWIFLINLPIGVLAWLAAVRVLAPDPSAGSVRGADYPGAALVTGALMLTVYTIVGAGDLGTSTTAVLAASALALFVAFTVRQGRVARPLLRLRLFRSRLLTGANAVQVLMVATMYGFQFIGALYLQRVLGYGELATGTAFLPAPVAIGVLMLGFSARTVGRFGAYRVLLAGLTLIVAGLALLSRAPVDGSYVTDVLPPMLLLAVGFAAAMPALTGLAMAGVREEDAGLASGLFNTTQVVGGSLGLAVLSTLAAGRTEGLLGEGAAPVAATAEGYQLAFRVAVVVAVAALVLAAVVLRERAGRGR